MDELEKWTMPVGRGVDARSEDHEWGGQVCSRTEHEQAMALLGIVITEEALNSLVGELFEV